MNKIAQTMNNVNYLLDLKNEEDENEDDAASLNNNNDDNDDDDTDKPKTQNRPSYVRFVDPSTRKLSMASSSRSLSAFDENEHYWNPPPTHKGEPLHVDFRCACFKLNNISTVDFSVKIKFVIVFEWKDARLVNHDSIYSTNDLPRDLWGPDVILENAENDCEVVYDSFSLLNNKTGLLKRTITFHGSVYNPMDLKDFPFDWDELELKFISICNWRTLDGSRYGNDVCNRTYTLHPMVRRKDVQFFVLGWGGKIPEFQILGWSQKVTIPDDVSQPIIFKFDIHLVRKANFYYLKIMIPLWLLVLSSVAAFGIGIEIEEFSGRLEVLFTLLLSTIAFLYIVQESIPKINHLTVIDKVVLASLTSLALSVLFSYIISRTPDKDEGEYLNLILQITYPFLYVIANLIIIAPPHVRQNRYKAKMIAKQRTNITGSRGSIKLGSFQTTIGNGRKSMKLHKSYGMDSENVMNLRGSDRNSETSNISMMGFTMPAKRSSTNTNNSSQLNDNDLQEVEENDNDSTNDRFYDSLEMLNKRVSFKTAYE